MFSKNEVELLVGQRVWILEIPIVGQHKFVEGVITKLTEKQVVIEAVMKDRWGDVSKREVKRYPDQVFVIL